MVKRQQIKVNAFKWDLVLRLVILIGFLSYIDYQVASKVAPEWIFIGYPRTRGN
jgi:hypothetical protein